MAVINTTNDEAFTNWIGMEFADGILGEIWMSMPETRTTLNRPSRSVCITVQSILTSSRGSGSSERRIHRSRRIIDMADSPMDGRSLH